MRETWHRPPSAAAGFSVYRHSARTHQAAQRVAGPFPSWREAFLVQCTLAQTTRADGAGYVDRFVIGVDWTPASRAA